MTTPPRKPKDRPFANRPKTRKALISRARNCTPGRQANCPKHGTVITIQVGGIDYCPHDGCTQRTYGNKNRG